MLLSSKILVLRSWLINRETTCHNRKPPVTSRTVVDAGMHWTLTYVKPHSHSTHFRSKRWGSHLLWHLIRILLHAPSWTRRVAEKYAYAFTQAPPDEILSIDRCIQAFFFGKRREGRIVERQLGHSNCQASTLNVFLTKCRIKKPLKYALLEANPEIIPSSSIVYVLKAIPVSRVDKTSCFNRESFCS